MPYDFHDLVLLGTRRRIYRLLFLARMPSRVDQKQKIAEWSCSSSQTKKLQEKGG